MFNVAHLPFVCLLPLVLAASVLGCSHAVAAPAAALACGPTVCGPHALRAPVETDRPATHGMLVVGSRTVYLSHLPMFHAPHDYQVIVEARFGAAHGNPQAAYVADRARTGTAVYTLVPEPFVLPDVIQHQKSFSATLFRGHFERGGTPILDHVKVDITRVLLFRKFDPTATRPADLQYFLFGKGDETFLAHLIVAPPDYDQVVQVKPDAPLPDGTQAAGEAIAVAAHTQGQFLAAGEHATANAPGGALSFGVLREFYHETGDLAD